MFAASRAILTGSPAVRPAMRRCTFTTSAPRPIAKLTLIGRLTADPETVTTSNGQEFIKYTIASNYKSRAGEEKPNFFNVASFEEHGKQYLSTIKKGCLVHVDATMNSAQYQGEDGKNHFTYNIYQRSINVLSRPRDRETGENDERGV